VTGAAPLDALGVVALNHDARELFDLALSKARAAAFAPGEFVGQESFMPASEIVRLAERAHIGPHTSVLDVCCGVGGPGLLLTRHFGCTYHGVDASAAAVRIARERAGGLTCRFDVYEIPPLPPGRYDVVVLLETLLAFADKERLLRGICDVLPIGGRLAFTVEEGQPLTDAERALMPEPDTVWPVPLPDLVARLGTVGLRVTSQQDCSRTHAAMAQRLHDAFVADKGNLERQIGTSALESLLASHRLWSDWLRSGRMRKFALVAEKMRRSRA
jgi:SAM-dependent methyltransferase